MVKADGTPLVSSVTVRLGISVMVGGSFTGLTVRTNASLALAPLVSVTVTVIVTVPDKLVAGEIVTPRLLPLPPNEMRLRGARLVLDEATLKASAPAGVESSPIVKGATAGVSSLTDRSLISEMPGASFDPNTVTVKVRLTLRFVLWPSSTVTVRLAVPAAFD